MPKLGKYILALNITALVIFALAGCAFLFSGMAPSTPTDFTATDGVFVDKVGLTWSPVPEAGGYEVWRSTSATGEFVLLEKTAHTSYDDRDVTPGTTYWYKVRACNRAGCSEFTQAKSGKARPPIPATPTELSASQGTFADRVRLSWRASTGAERYEVHRATAEDGSYTSLATVTATTYDDQDVQVGSVYWYKVRACSVGGCSPFSAAVSGYAATAALPAPENVSATDGTKPGKVVVTWSAVSGATHYLVYRASAEDGEYELKASVTEARYEDTAVAEGQTYWYKVRACNIQGCSPLSSADSGFPGEEPPPPPSP